MKFQGNCGEIEVTEKAMRKIVYYALQELSESVSVSAKNWLQKFLSNFGSEDSNVKITESDVLIVDLYINVEYGVNIPTLYTEIARKVREYFKVHIGVEHLDLNLHVVDVKQE
ncbi:MAG: Asp23/Gls24 family envelope stress response protein [Fervidobacterium sp.]